MYERKFEVQRVQLIRSTIKHNERNSKMGVRIRVPLCALIREKALTKKRAFARARDHCTREY